MRAMMNRNDGFCSPKTPSHFSSFSTSTSTKKKPKKNRRPRRGQGRLPLARPDRPGQVEGGAHGLRGPRGMGDRDLVGDEDLRGREEGRQGCVGCCRAGKVIFSFFFSFLFVREREKPLPRFRLLLLFPVLILEKKHPLPFLCL